jgi:hypothetical protein
VRIKQHSDLQRKTSRACNGLAPAHRAGAGFQFKWCNTFLVRTFVELPVNRHFSRGANVMNKIAVISAAALVAALGASAPTFGQGTEHKIGGKLVPATQIEAVQAKCDELRAAGSAGTDATAKTDATADAEPVASVDPAAAAETAAESASGTAAGTSTTSTEATGTATTDDTISTETATSTSADTSAEAEIDLDTLTIAMCDEGGFTAKGM